MSRPTGGALRACDLPGSEASPEAMIAVSESAFRPMVWSLPLRSGDLGRVEARSAAAGKRNAEQVTVARTAPASAGILTIKGIRVAGNVKILETAAGGQIATTLPAVRVAGTRSSRRGADPRAGGRDGIHELRGLSRGRGEERGLAGIEDLLH